MINIVIPMAGLGSRFKDAGYSVPKPFIDVAGKPMIVRVMENLKCDNSRFILLARQEHIDAEKELVERIKTTFNALILPVEKLTEGTACTVLLARKYINNDSPLMIANSDQLVDINIQEYVDDCLNRKLDGSILTFIESDMNNKWSYVKLNDKELVSEVKEKVAISNIATVGIYVYSSGKEFVNSAIDMIVNNDRVNNEFYTCPTYNYAIMNDLKIGCYNIDRGKMHGLGIPEDLDKYLAFIKNSKE